MMRTFPVQVLTLLMLSACGKPAAECSTDASKNAAISVIKDKIVTLLTAQLSSGDGNSGNQIGPSTIRAAVDKVAFSIDDIRTFKNDANSSKRNCNGEVRAVVPLDILNSSNQLRRSSGYNTVSQFADLNGIRAEANKYATELAYIIQSPADGKNVHAETAAETPFIKFLATVVSDSLTAVALQQAKVEADRQAAETASALEAKRKADLHVAQANNRTALRVMGAAWQSLRPEIRKQFHPPQWAWSRKVRADCRVEATGVSTDPLEIQTAQLACETRESAQRTDELRHYQVRNISG